MTQQQLENVELQQLILEVAEGAAKARVCREQGISTGAIYLRLCKADGKRDQEQGVSHAESLDNLRALVEGYQGTGNCTLESYLRMKAKFAVLEILRTNRRRERETYMGELIAEHAAPPPDSRHSETAELIDKIKQLSDKLPPRQRALMQLLFANRPRVEIRRTLQLGDGRLSHLRRGTFRNLRKLIDDDRRRSNNEENMR